MNKPSKPLVLVDGSSYLYRAYHAMPSLANSKGLATGAIYGMINMLRRLLKDYDPDYIAVVFDAKGRTFRDDIYDKYKANRVAMPNELIQQLPPIYELIRAYGIPILTIEGVEADDVIGTLAKQATQQNHPTLVSTGDKDLAQLVDDHITLVNTMSDTILTPETVKEKFGIPPKSIIDYLALVGDTVDNIPGVPGVGPKTAAKWLQEYGSLDTLIQKSRDIKGKVGDNFRAVLDQLPLSKILATIKLDVPLATQFSDLKRTPSDTATLIKLFQELEFKTWLNELLEANAADKSHASHYETILTDKQLDQWITQITEKKYLSFAIHATDLNYMDAQIIGFSCALSNTSIAYLPLAHRNEQTQLSKEFALQKLKPLLQNKDIKKIIHNVKHTIELLANVDINLQGAIHDVMLESYVLDSTSNKHMLDTLALKFLGKRLTSLEEIAGKGVKQVPLTDVSIEKTTPFVSERADVTLQLHDLLWPRIEKEPGLKSIYETIELPLSPVLAKIERTGVLIDADRLNKQTLELEKRLSELEEEVFTLAGEPFNMSSPKQLQEILFDKLKLPVLQKTPKGQASTADPVLQELALDYLLPKLIIEHRSLTKLISTYTKKLPEQINAKTGRIHTTYHQTGAATGRLSSSDPNLQNIPIRTQEGRRIRKAFIASKGYKLVSADYSQIELRLMAHISQEPNLLNAFEKNLDIHIATAAEVLNISLDAVSYEERRSAKAINFGLIYGMSAFGLAKQIGVDRQKAQDYIDRYFTRYPQVKAYMENTRVMAHIKGYVETLLGRRVHLPDINSSQMPRQKAAERAAINGPLQGTAADIIKRAMVSIDDCLTRADLDARMIMQVHDELVFEVAEHQTDALVKLIQECMMNAASLDVPLLVSIGTGDNWDDSSKD